MSLTVIKDYLTTQEADSVVSYLDGLFKARTGKDRGIMRFGLTRSYGSNKASDTIPPTLSNLASKLIDDGFCPEIRHVTVNRYDPGQSIAYHVDSPEAGDKITVISLASDAVMLFMDKKGKVTEHDIPARSLVQFSDEHRWNNKHGIKPVKKLRYSIVFRKQ